MLVYVFLAKMFVFCFIFSSSDVGADVLDTTGQSVVSFGQLEEEDTWFELSPTQQSHFFAAQRLNNMLREENHSIQQLLWKSGYQRIFGDMPKRLLR